MLLRIVIERPWIQSVLRTPNVGFVEECTTSHRQQYPAAARPLKHLDGLDSAGYWIANLWIAMVYQGAIEINRDNHSVMLWHYIAPP
jgi:hypothetical protein